MMIARWSAGALPKTRRLMDAVRDHALLLGQAVIWTSDWVSMPPVVLAADDVVPGRILLVYWLSGLLF